MRELWQFILRFSSRSLILTAATFCAVAHGEVVPLHKLSKKKQEERIESDLKAVSIYRLGLQRVTKFALGQTNLFSPGRLAVTNLPRREEKEVLWQTWQSYLDYLVALDSIEKFHQQFYRLSGKRHDQSFLVCYSAFLAKYRCSLELIEAAKNNPQLDKILNEPVPESGLPGGTYAKMKFHFLNVTTATDFSASEAFFPVVKKAASDELLRTINEDSTFVWKMGGGKGELLQVQNALKILCKARDSAWFPIQTCVAEWMGHTKVYRLNRSLISQAQLKELPSQLLPGDILLIRHEWYLSNVGLPGFWPHAAIYIGTPEDRKKFFADAEVENWVKGKNVSSGGFEDLLKTSSPNAYARCLQDEKKRQIRILEAISPVVSFTPIEHAADADSVVVLRPKLSKVEKANALLRAFHYAGRPYDFNFDFTTDSELVCTELVYKSYEPAKGIKGLKLPLTQMLGRPLLPANEIAKQFDQQFDTPEAQMDFVLFLDGDERGNKARSATVDDFRRSWQRPKWHILQQALK